MTMGNQRQDNDPTEDLLQGEQGLPSGAKSSGDDRRSRTSSGDDRRTVKSSGDDR